MKNVTLYTKQRTQVPLIRDNKGTSAGVDHFDNLMRLRAWSFHKTTGLPFEDLYSVCTEAYAKAIHMYDGRGTQFSTMLHSYCTNALINYCKREGGENRESLMDWDSFAHPTIESGIDLKRMVKDLSNEGKAVVDILFNCSGELLEIIRDSYNSNMGKSRNIKCALKKFLKKLHWPDAKIKTTFNEIQGMISAL